MPLFPIETDVLVVGAGPAGLMAALAAASNGMRVTVLEQLGRPGAKLLASGGGRCNLTNTLSPGEFADRFGRQGRFMLPAMETLSADRLRELLGTWGVPTECPDGFHVFPVSNRAGDVLAALRRECERHGVYLRLGVKVEKLLMRDGAVCGVETDVGGVEASRVIVACGGKGYSGLGGTGGGYRLAAQAGHEIIEPVPGLVGLVTEASWPGSCAGVVIPDVELYVDLPKLRKSTLHCGDLLFTHRGISGIPVIDLSATVARLLTTRPTVPMRLNLLPGIPASEWERRLADWQKQDGRKTVRRLISQFLPNSVAEAVCREAGNVGERRAAELPKGGREKLLEWLTGIPLAVAGTEGFAKAMVTSGGVALNKVDPKTLQSRLVSGLYFSGEVLDLDGPCGGFNLQWAFSSGWLAGRSC